MDWVNGTFTGASEMETLQLNSEAIGRARTLALVAEMEYSDVCGGGL